MSDEYEVVDVSEAEIEAEYPSLEKQAEESALIEMETIESEILAVEGLA